MASTLDADAHTIRDPFAIDIPHADPAKLNVLYAPQFEAAVRLINTVWSHRPDGVEIDRARNVRVLLLHLLGRTTLSYRGVLQLCGAGLTDQAQMICRSLFEDMIATYWARLPDNREQVLERVVRQERHWDERFDRALKKQGVRVPDPIDLVGDDEWVNLEGEFNRGRRSWFGQLGDARDQVLRQLDETKEADLVRSLSELHNLYSNMTLHSTVEGLKAGAVKPLKYQGRYFFPYDKWESPSEEGMRWALYAGSSCYALSATQVFREFAIDPTPITEARHAVENSLFRGLMPSERSKRLGPNDRCWCGSGLKLKKCHTA